jgi:hypothetical protein
MSVCAVSYDREEVMLRYLHKQPADQFCPQPPTFTMPHDSLYGLASGMCLGLGALVDGTRTSSGTRRVYERWAAMLGTHWRRASEELAALVGQATAFLVLPCSREEVSQPLRQSFRKAHPSALDMSDYIHRTAGVRFANQTTVDAISRHLRDEGLAHIWNGLGKLVLVDDYMSSGRSLWAMYLLARTIWGDVPGIEFAAPGFSGWNHLSHQGQPSYTNCAHSEQEQQTKTDSGGCQSRS